MERALRDHLAKFTAKVNGKIAEVTVADINQFLTGLKHFSPVSKNGIRRNIVTMFSFAKKQSYIHPDRKTAAGLSEKFKEEETDIEIFTPEEMGRILLAAHSRILPFLGIGAFAGIRSEEIHRLHWSDIKWDRGHIEIEGKKAKAAARRLVPLTDNLKAWLAPWREATGPIVPISETPGALSDVAMKAKIPRGWRRENFHTLDAHPHHQIQAALRLDGSDSEATEPSASTSGEIGGINGWKWMEMEVFLRGVMLPPRIQPTNEILRLIASIDEFKGEWRAVESIKPERLQSLRRVATIESIGSSTRIEGAKLSDREVETLLRGLQTESFRSRDEQEVAGYAYVMETIQASWQEMPVTEGIVLQLHRDLLRYSTKDERHRGQWKGLPNHVVAVGPDGGQIGIVFETASPFDTPRLMEDLFAWLAKEERDPILHPLLHIAVFVVVFLAIHPFQDGNGRLSRILNNLLLLRSGYSFASYSSLESIIEHTKEAYYLALRRTQTTLNTESADWEPWLLFFLHSIQSQIVRLRENLDAAEAKIPHREISPLAERLVKLLVERGSLTVAEAASATDANRNTIKDKFAELVGQGLAELHGKGRGAHYRPADS